MINSTQLRHIANQQCKNVYFRRKIQKKIVPWYQLIKSSTVGAVCHFTWRVSKTTRNAATKLTHKVFRLIKNIVSLGKYFLMGSHWCLTMNEEDMRKVYLFPCMIFVIIGRYRVFLFKTSCTNFEKQV